MVKFLSSCCRRAKEKRLKKDAGRTRWSQYFRSMKGTGAGGHSPRHDKLLEKDELKVDLDSTFGHHGKYTYHLYNLYLIKYCSDYIENNINFAYF